MTNPNEKNQQEKFELIGRISAGLAHELGGPIGIALGFTELAKESLGTVGGGIDGQAAAKLAEYLNLIESSTRRARQLTQEISDFGKAKPGRVGEFDLGDLVGRAATLAGPAVKFGQLEIVAKGEIPEGIAVKGDEALTLQCLVNLMLSSMHALPEGGSVFWEVRSLQGDESGGEFVLTAEPWGEVSSNEWPVDEQVKTWLESQGGRLDPVTGVSMKSGGPSALAWIVSGRLPAASDAVGQAS